MPSASRTLTISRSGVSPLPTCFHLMNDERVRRGVTVTLQRAPSTGERQNAPNKRAVGKATLIQRGDIRPTPPSIESLAKTTTTTRVRRPIDIAQFITDTTQPPMTVCETNQTDEWMDEREVVTFMAARASVVTCGTQTDEGETFVFADECAHIGNGVVDAIIQQSIGEVKFEAEMQRIEARRNDQIVIECREAQRKTALLQKEREQIEAHKRRMQSAKVECERRDELQRRLSALRVGRTTASTVVNEQIDHVTAAMDDSIASAASSALIQAVSDAANKTKRLNAAHTALTDIVTTLTIGSR